MKNILTKLHKVMSEIPFIPKDKINEFHGYKYASEYAIKVALHKAFVANGVLFTLSTSNMRNTPITTSKGDNSLITHISCTYKFYDIESGESLEGTFIGTGEEKLDKGTYKAITGAIKYILTSTFLIPTGDDPEKESKPPQKQAKAYNKPQAEPTPAGVKMKPCDNCGKQFKLRNSAKVQFYGCSGYPNCKRTMTVEDAEMWQEEI